MKTYLLFAILSLSLTASATTYNDCVAKTTPTPGSQQADANKTLDKEICSCMKASPKANGDETDDAELMSDFLSCEDAKKVETDGVDRVPLAEEVKPSEVKELLPAQY